MRAAAAPIEERRGWTDDAHIYTAAHLYAFGTHGDGPELAECIIYTPDYDDFYTALRSGYAVEGDVSIKSYSSYPSLKQMLLAPRVDERKAVEIFVSMCSAHAGAPHRYA